jgi:hypothetical protein
LSRQRNSGCCCWSAHVIFGDVSLVGGTLRTTSFQTGVPLIIDVGSKAHPTDYSQDSSGTLALGIAGINDFDRVQVARNASLSGTLAIFSLNQFRPVAGDAFEILHTNGSRTGEFAHINDALNNNPNLERVNVYAPNGVELVYIKGKGEIDDVEPDPLPAPPIVLLDPTAEQLAALFEIPFSGANIQVQSR